MYHIMSSVAFFTMSCSSSPQLCYCGQTASLELAASQPRLCLLVLSVKIVLSYGHQGRQLGYAGAFPDCTGLVSVQRFIGKSMTPLLCGVEPISCGEGCKKPLKSGIYRYDVLCHDGDCDPCKFRPSNWYTFVCGKWD